MWYLRERRDFLLSVWTCEILFSVCCHPGTSRRPRQVKYHPQTTWLIAAMILSRAGLDVSCWIKLKWLKRAAGRGEGDTESGISSGLHSRGVGERLGDRTPGGFLGTTVDTKTGSKGRKVEITQCLDTQRRKWRIAGSEMGRREGQKPVCLCVWGWGWKSGLMSLRQARRQFSFLICLSMYIVLTIEQR